MLQYLTISTICLIRKSLETNSETSRCIITWSRPCPTANGQRKRQRYPTIWIWRIRIRIRTLPTTPRRSSPTNIQCSAKCSRESRAPFDLLAQRTKIRRGSNVETNRLYRLHLSWRRPSQLCNKPRLYTSRNTRS